MVRSDFINYLLTVSEISNEIYISLTDLTHS